MNIAIVIPAFKESENIENLIKSILEVIENPLIIIVDDSPDRQIEAIIKAFNNIHYIYRGKKWEGDLQ